MVDIQSVAAEIRRGIKKEDRKKPQGKNIMFASATQDGHNNVIDCNIKLLGLTAKIYRPNEENQLFVECRLILRTDVMSTFMLLQLCV